MTGGGPHPRTFLFAGGGSGGHLSPGLAVAERLGEIDPGARALFACSGRAVDRMMLEQAGADFERLPGSPFSVRPAGLLRFLRDFRRSRRTARDLLHRNSVERVLALGGFIAAPVVSAAVRLGTPVTLLNLDAPPGKANRWMARRCREVLSAVPVPELPRFARQVVGMPVRRQAIAPGPPDECRQALDLSPDTPTLLVTGASQGAGSINALLAALVETEPDALAGWQVLHLSGPRDERHVAGAYAAAGIRAVVRPFLDPMGLAWGAADLAVSRAGASSVAEAWANAVPTIFLPYPHHRDQHQRRNAEPMADAGGAVVEVDRVAPGSNLPGAGAAIRRLTANAAEREAMRARLRDRPPPDAAALIARLLVGSDGPTPQDS